MAVGDVTSDAQSRGGEREAALAGRDEEGHDDVEV